jgi:hypothetical protein
MIHMQRGQFARITDCLKEGCKGYYWGDIVIRTPRDTFVCVHSADKYKAPGDWFDLEAAQHYEVEPVQTYEELAAEVNNLRFRLEGLEK